MEFPTDCQSCPVWKKSLFVDLDSDLIQWLTERKQTCTMKTKDILFNQGDEVTGMYCHMDGLVKVTQKDEIGNIRFSRLVLPGDTSGHRSIFIAQNYKGSAKVISDSFQACFIKKEDIMHLFTHNVSFARNLVVKISHEVLRSEQQQIAARERSVRCRLAKLLCQLCDEYAEQVYGSQYLIKSSITKKELSEILSVASETMIRQMSDMKAEGLISYQGKQILVNDISKLRQIAKS